MIVKRRPLSVTARPSTCGSAANLRRHRPSPRTMTSSELSIWSSSVRKVRPSAGVAPSSEKYEADTNSVSRRSELSVSVSVCICESTAARSSNERVACARQSRKSGYDAPLRSIWPRSTLPIKLTSRSGSLYGMACVRVASTTLKTAVLPPMPTASARTATAAKPGERSRLRPACRTSIPMLSSHVRIFIGGAHSQTVCRSSPRRPSTVAGVSRLRNGSRSVLGRDLSVTAHGGSSRRAGPVLWTRRPRYDHGMKRSGVADLPLHGGRVPAWLASRMSTLGTAIAESVMLHYGRPALLSRLSDPFWFQALGSVMGMDWHSSGITTSVMGALKRGLNPRAHELGVYICGGRGKQSRNTPSELRAIADRINLDGDALVRTSRLTARVDNNAVADGFQIYLHSFILTGDGDWAVVQQGMNEDSRLARRYHWHSAAVRDFTSEPHTAIVGEHAGTIMNLVDREARPAQEALLAITRDDPSRTLADIRAAYAHSASAPRLVMPAHHDVRATDVNEKRLGAVLALAHERDLRDFASFLLLEQLGPRTLQSLALVAEVVHGAPTRFEDPARFAFAHGGKDGHPFPVPLKVYDESIAVLRRALDSAKLGHTDKLGGFKRLDAFTRAIETQRGPEADVSATIAHERAISATHGGRTVFDDQPSRSALRPAGPPSRDALRGAGPPSRDALRGAGPPGPRRGQLGLFDDEPPRQ